MCLSCHDGAVTGNSHDLITKLGGAGTFGTNTTPSFNPGSGIAGSFYNGSATNNGWSYSSSLATNHPIDAKYPVNVGDPGYGLYWLVTINAANNTVSFTDTSFIPYVGEVSYPGHPARLYTDGSSAYVECTSCHEPHRETHVAYKNGSTWVVDTAVGTANPTTMDYIRGPFLSTNGNMSGGLLSQLSLRQDPRLRQHQRSCSINHSMEGRQVRPSFFLSQDSAHPTRKKINLYMNKLYTLLILCTLSTVTIWGQDMPVLSHPPTSGSQVAPAVTPPPDLQKVVARVNGVNITQRDLREQMQRLFPYYAIHGGTVPEKYHAEIRDKAMQQLIDEELIYQAAKKLGMTVPPATMTRMLADARKHFPTQRQYAAYVTAQYGSVAAFEGRIRARGVDCPVPRPRNRSEVQGERGSTAQDLRRQQE